MLVSVCYVNACGDLQPGGQRIQASFFNAEKKHWQLIRWKKMQPLIVLMTSLENAERRLLPEEWILKPSYWQSTLVYVEWLIYMEVSVSWPLMMHSWGMAKEALFSYGESWSRSRERLGTWENAMPLQKYHSRTIPNERKTLLSHCKNVCMRFSVFQVLKRKQNVYYFFSRLWHPLHLRKH